MPRPSDPSPSSRSSSPAEPHDLFFLNSLGDVFAFESFWSAAFRRSLRKIFWFTPSHTALVPLFRLLPPYAHLEHETNLCRHELPESVHDWGIVHRAPLLTLSDYHDSSFLNYPLADVSSFALPRDYLVVHPYTAIRPRQARAQRDFRPADWARTLATLEHLGVPGVVLNTGRDAVPAHPLVVNLANRTTLPEAIEVLKGGCGYIGIDSCFSVLACRRFPPDRIVIRAINPHYYEHFALYGAPVPHPRNVVFRTIPPPGYSALTAK